jgi:hypothetical protein
MTGPDDAFLAPDDALQDEPGDAPTGGTADDDRPAVAPGEDDTDHDGPTGSAAGGVEPA